MASVPQDLPGFRPGGVLKDEEAVATGGAIGSRHMILIDQLIAWAIANPGKGWSEAARRLSLSNIFVRHIVSSDAFRERYAQVQNRTIEELGIIPLKEKIAVAADLAVERLAERLPLMESTRDLLDTADLLLAQSLGKPGAGMGGNPAPQHQTIVIQQAILDGRTALLGGAGEPRAVDAALAPALPHSSSASPPIAASVGGQSPGESPEPLASVVPLAHAPAPDSPPPQPT